MSDFDAFRALSFDCYGTLIDWETGLTAALEPWSTAHDVSAGREELLQAFGRAEAEVERERPEALYPAVLAMTLDRLAAQYGVDATDTERVDFGASVRHWPAFPDSAEALARLKERFKLIILSNVDRDSFAASNALLGVDFDLVITAEDVGTYKPDRRNFDALLDGVGGLGVGAGELLHVAQSLYHDHEPARAAGLSSVWIDRRNDRQGGGATAAPAGVVTPQWRFPSLAEFADVATTPR